MEQNKQMMILSLVPKPLPDFISQLWREIGSGLGTRLAILVYLM